MSYTVAVYYSRDAVMSYPIFFQAVQRENMVSGFPICAFRYFINDYYSELYVNIELAIILCF